MSEPRPPAVIVGLASTIGLQAARLLSARGVRVIGLAGSPRHFATRTRACERVIDADVHGEGFLDVLARLGRELGEKAVLVPCTDRAVLLASQHRDTLVESYHLPLAAHGVVRALSDKARFAELAARHALPVPSTAVINCRRDAVRASIDLRFPVVIKPSVKCSAWKGATSAKVVRVEDPAAMMRLYGRVSATVPSLVAQEYVEGSDDQLFTCNGYFGSDSEPLVTFTTRKKRQWPPHLGIASYAVECREDAVTETTTNFFRSVGFHGLGYLEMKRDLAGELRIIEANVGRPTGRSATAEAAGVELLMTMYCDAAGLPLPEPVEPSGTRPTAWIDVRRDTMAAWHYWRGGELSAGDWLADLRRPKVHAVYSRHDPLPFVLECVQSAVKAVRRLLRRRTIDGSASRRSPATTASTSPPAHEQSGVCREAANLGSSQGGVVVTRHQNAGPMRPLTWSSARGE